MKKTVSLLVAVAALIAACVFPVSAEAGTPFSDVPESAWFYEPVMKVWDAGIMNGTSASKFSPGSPMTRGQIVTILARLSGDDLTVSGDVGFSDVPAGKYYAAPVAWAVRVGITKGRSETRFAPDAPVLRQEFASFFVRYMRYKDIFAPGEDVDPFPDEAPEWARVDIEELHRIGFVRGDGNGCFNPKKEMSRAEISTVVARFLDVIANQNRYERVVLIGVDGGGAYFRDADTPNMDRIFAQGAVTHSALTSIPTISAQCWGSMLHGVTPEFHRLTNSVVANREYNPDSSFPSVFRVIRENDPEANLASFCNWEPINRGIVEEGIGVYKDGGGDTMITDKICEYVKTNDPKLLFVQFDEADGAGHTNGFGSEKHLKQITAEDENIGRIYDAYAETGMLNGTLFIVTADHGGSGTSHGGTSDTEKYVTFAAAGYSVEAGEIRDMEIRDTAAIVLYALGYAKPSTWTARIPAGLFENVPAGRRPVYERKYSFPHRTHEPTPTPSVDALRTALGDRGIRLYMPLDGSVDDAAGNYEVKKVGKIYYPDGYFGSGGIFDDGLVFAKDVPFASDSFSLCFWMKTPDLSDSDEMMFLGNYASNEEGTVGFSLRMRTDDIRVSINYPDGSYTADFVLPEDYPDGWFHFALSVDAEAGTVSASFDFGEFVTRKVADGPIGPFDGDSKFWVGYDVDQGGVFPGELDEFMILDGVLTADGLAALADYYGAGG